MKVLKKHHTHTQSERSSPMVRLTASGTVVSRRAMSAFLSLPMKIYQL